MNDLERTGNTQEGLRAVGDDEDPGARHGRAASDPTPSAAAALVPLESLAAHYDKSQHKSYLQRLEAAVKDPKNRNIALTGRYGTGKSSILEQFEKNHKKKTLRLSISTLGPEATETSLTNRIQKDLVKQLIYSASPKHSGTLPSSASPPHRSRVRSLSPRWAWP